MNRLLITQSGEQLRNEMKQTVQEEQRMIQVSKQKQKLPIVLRKKTTLFIDTDRDNALFQQSQSEIALNNLQKAASLSLFGLKSKTKLENQIREDLNLPPHYSYLNKTLSKQVNKILEDKDLQSKRKRQLVLELKRLEKFRTVSMNEDTSRFSSYVEEFDKNQKFNAILNAEGKLSQMNQRYEQKEQEERNLRRNLNLSLGKLKQKQVMQIESINPLSPLQLKENANKEMNSLFKDKSEERFQQRLHERHRKHIYPIWEQHQFPQQTKRWQQFIMNAKQH